MYVPFKNYVIKIMKYKYNITLFENACIYIHIRGITTCSMNQSSNLNHKV
jgi:hypothetical protein